jgi:hypothetical protein
VQEGILVAFQMMMAFQGHAGCSAGELLCMGVACSSGLTSIIMSCFAQAISSSSSQGAWLCLFKKQELCAGIFAGG